MKQGDLCPTRLGHAIRKLKDTVAAVPVEHLSAAQAKQLVDLSSEAVTALTALRSRSALQVARAQSATLDAGSVKRVIQNSFDSSSLSQREVKHETAKAQTLEALPKLEKNLSAIPSSNFDVVAKHVGRLKSDQVQTLNENLIVRKAKDLGPDQFERVLANHVRESTSDLLTDHKAMRAASKVKHWLDSTTGMGHIHAELDPERYEIVANRIDRTVTSLANANKAANGSSSNATKDSNLAAEAFCSLVGVGPGTQSKTAATNKTTRPAPVADLIILVDHKTLKSGRHNRTVAETESGTALPDETISRLTCDSTIRKVEVDSVGLALNVGRKSRTATDAQWAATKAMHSTCAWDGCGTKIQHCQLHHIQYWRNGGKTNMNNLVPLCSHHHHKVHEGGWSLKLKPDRSLVHIKPDKTVWKQTKPPNRLDSG